jgi:hypothetical protein
MRRFNGLSGAVTTSEAIIALRIVSATLSVATVYGMWRIYLLLVKRAEQRFWHVFLFIFSPSLIQFAHFGTTESALMTLYTTLAYVSLRAVSQHTFSRRRFLLFSGALLGAACAVKVSSASFVLPVGLVYLHLLKKNDAGRNKLSLQSIIKHISYRVWELGVGVVAAVLVFALQSPHYLISYGAAASTILYESDVALGQIAVFYTRAFSYSLPILYPMVAIFPVALGLPLYIGGIALLLYAVVKRIRLPASRVVLGLFIVLYFLTSSIIFTKWTRFIAPIYPLIIVYVAVAYASIMARVKQQFVRVILYLFFFGMLIPGISYLRIYESPDVRFVASEWMAAHIPSGSVLLSETANVIDLPIFSRTYSNDVPNYTNISFNFYDLDQNPALTKQLAADMERADYIIVPSRRIFANHWCPKNRIDSPPSWWPVEVALGYESSRCTNLVKQYPQLNAYYDGLFSGRAGFTQVAQFSSYPRLELFGHTFFTLVDEQYDETWSVFDHPVIRIYKKSPPVALN